MSGWVHPAWGILGIAPTSDTRAIRVAYSAKLKGIDPEADPKAFVELRDAYEAAQVQAQWVDAPEGEADHGDPAWAEDLATSEPVEEASPPPPADPTWETAAPPERRSPWGGTSPEDADSHARALVTLLQSRDPAQPWPTPEQEAEMLAHWRAIIADPRMQEVSYFSDADHWFGEIIARNMAFSDPLVIPATDYFGWLNSDGAITQSAAVSHITHRYRMLEFQRAVKEPKHPLNPAWRELVQPMGKSHRRGKADIRKVRQLLTIVRTHYPDLEGCFDAERVSLWDGSHMGTGTGSGGDWSTYAWIGGVVLFILVRVALMYSETDRSPTPSDYPPPVVVTPQDRSVAPPPQIASPESPEYVPGDTGEGADRSAPITMDGELEVPDADLDQALESLYGDRLTIATIAQRKPGFYNELHVFWADQKARGVHKRKFAENLSALIAKRYPMGILWGDAPIMGK